MLTDFQNYFADRLCISLVVLKSLYISSSRMGWLRNTTQIITAPVVTTLRYYRKKYMIIFTLSYMYTLSRRIPDIFSCNMKQTLSDSDFKQFLTEILSQLRNEAIRSWFIFPLYLTSAFALTGKIRIASFLPKLC